MLSSSSMVHLLGIEEPVVPQKKRTFYQIRDVQASAAANSLEVEGPANYTLHLTAGGRLGADFVRTLACRR